MESYGILLQQKGKDFFSVSDILNDSNKVNRN